MHTPWIGKAISRTRGFLDENEDFHREYGVENQRHIGHAKTHRRARDPEEDGIRCNAGCCARSCAFSPLPYTPNIDLIQLTMVGAPKIAAMPTRAPITHPQDTLPTAAAIARPMTTSAAIGVPMVWAKVTREFAPV